MGIFDKLKDVFGGGSKEATPSPSQKKEQPPHIVPSKTLPVIDEFKEIKIYAPCSGFTVAQKDIPDPTFAEGHMGEGIGFQIKANQQKVFMDGVLVVISKTKHAYFIKDEASGVTVMYHIGIDTVEIDPSKDVFNTPRKVGEHVKAGEDLCTADVEKIIHEGKSAISPLLIQKENMDNRKVIIHHPPRTSVNAGELLMTIVHK